MSEYKAAFFIVPSRILELPSLILSHLRVYETIFQFLNKGNQCYLSNKTIKERTGISSVSTVKDALVFFEKHGELKRKTIKGQRYFVQPERSIKTENTPAAKSATPGRQVAPPPAAKSAHNIKKVNNKNINKEEDQNICAFEAFFDDFWNIYPNKNNKIRAKKVWMFKKYGLIYDKIEKDVKNRLLNDQKWKISKFIPNASTYLDEERWNDEIEIDSRQKKFNPAEYAIESLKKSISEMKGA